MDSYFAEYEFASESGEIYWLPIFLQSNTAEGAEKLAQSINIGLEERYTVRNRKSVRKVVREINSELIQQYLDTRMRGKLTTLNLNIWAFSDLPGTSDLSFSEHFRIIEADPKLIYDHNIAKTIATHQVPVRKLSQGLDDFNEVLVIHVVQPAA